MRPSSARGTPSAWFADTTQLTDTTQQRGLPPEPGRRLDGRVSGLSIFPRRPGRWGLAVALTVVVLSQGIAPNFLKMISGPPALATMAFRQFLTVPTIWVSAHLSGRRLTLPIVRRTALPGVLFGVSGTLTLASLQQTSVAVVTMVLALQPAAMLMIVGPMLSEWPRRWHIGWTIVATASATTAIVAGDPPAHGTLFGLLLALLAMLSHLCYSLLNRVARSTTDIDPVDWMLGVLVFASVPIVPLALTTVSVDDLRLFWGKNALLVVVVIVLSNTGHYVMAWTHAFLPAAKTALVLPTATSVAILAAWPINSERVTPLQAGGCACLFVAVWAVIARPLTGEVVRNVEGTLPT